MPKQKYRNKKCEFQGHVFDSALEMRRWIVLKDAERRGEITNLQRQVEYVLIPDQYRTEIVHLKTKDKYVEKLIERRVSYYADFVYRKGDLTVVEDTKGLRLADYKIKRKLMLFQRGIRIREVEKATEGI
ncbi:MAG: DUF1064 domain-containing protein [Bacteroidales bacterium]|nr:DUF1064 domain-containing protein [Bacteroidales bacterium]